jgi:hypothetical protein
MGEAGAVPKLRPNRPEKAGTDRIEWNRTELGFFRISVCFRETRRKSNSLERRANPSLNQ